MSAPVVDIFIAAPAPGETRDAMVVATSEALPPDARVRIVEREEPSADVVVRVEWADDTRRHARVLVRIRDGREATRTVSFGAADPDRERGRALGYAVAAMIPDDVRGTEPTAKPAPAAPPPPPPPAAEPPPPSPPPSPPPPAPARLWIDASAQGAAGIGGSATGLGGSLALRMPIAPFVLRVGGAVRAGGVSEADASSVIVRGDAGVGVYTVIVDPRMTVGARTGFVLLHHRLARTAGGVETSGARTLPGAEALVEASFALSHGFALIAAAGTEIAFGSTDVLVGTTKVAVIPPVRGIGELGVRLAF